ARVDVDDGDAIGFLALGIERRHVGELLGRRLHGHARRRIECRVGCPSRHAQTSSGTTAMTPFGVGERLDEEAMFPLPEITHSSPLPPMIAMRAIVVNATMRHRTVAILCTSWLVVQF